MLVHSNLITRVEFATARERVVAKAFHDHIAAEYLRRAAEHLNAAAALERPAAPKAKTRRKA